MAVSDAADVHCQAFGVSSAMVLVDDMKQRTKLQRAGADSDGNVSSNAMEAIGGAGETVELFGAHLLRSSGETYVGGLSLIHI